MVTEIKHIQALTSNGLTRIKIEQWTPELECHFASIDQVIEPYDPHAPVVTGTSLSSSLDYFKPTATA